MATTESQSNTPARAQQMAAGSHIIESGDVAAAIKIVCGFTPRYVKVFNVTGGSTGLISMEWFEGMDDDNGIKTYDEGTSETGITLVSSNGITPASDGFTIGLDSDLNVKAEQLHWIAFS